MVHGIALGGARSRTSVLSTLRCLRNCNQRQTQKTTTDKGHDWNQRPEFFEFTRGRFVSDEAAQIACRRVRFDMNELAKTAAASVGAQRCIAVDKCPDGLYNKAFIFTLDDGRQIIGKVPNPNAGTSHFTTASEVATLDFVRSLGVLESEGVVLRLINHLQLKNVLQTPVPQVYAWSSRSDATPVGAEYILMEKVQGVPLLEKWKQLEPAEKLKILVQLDRLQQMWTGARFPKFGSLYYRRDLRDRSDDEYLFRNHKGTEVVLPGFAIGPATGREWVEHGRQDLTCDQGPWRSLIDYKRAVGYREIEALERLRPFPRPDIMVCGPKLYIPTAAKKLSALKSYQTILPYILPQEADQQFGYLWHNDLHDENIFVDAEEPTKITGIIDWQSTQITPLYDHVLEPSFLEYSGPELNDNLDRPQLPKDVDTLPPEERSAAISKYYEQGLMVAWRRLIRNNNPSQYDAIRFGNTTPGHLISLGRRLYSLGEAHFMALLLDLKQEWAELPAVREGGAPTFPLVLKDAECSRIEEDMRLVDEGIQMMEYMAGEFGDLWPEKGIVRHDQYEKVKAELRDARENLVTYLKLSRTERDEFDRYWPFDR